METVRGIATRELTRRDHYAADMALVLRQRRSDQETTLQVRRVIPSSGEELQIEIEIVRIGLKRNTTMHSSFILSPELADKLAAACLELRKPGS